MPGLWYISASLAAITGLHRKVNAKCGQDGGSHPDIQTGSDISLLQRLML